MTLYFIIGACVGVIFWIGAMVAAAMEADGLLEFAALFFLINATTIAVAFFWPLVLIAGLIYAAVMWMGEG